MMLLMLGLLFNPVQYISQQFIFVPQGYSTPMRELEHHHKVTHGLVCYSLMEARCIDDLCGEPGKSYWQIKVNGDSVHYNGSSIVKPTDFVSWEFVQDGQTLLVHAD